MTLPIEEFYALKNTRELLRDILHSNLTEIRRNARSIRERAGRCLKHYPWDMYLEKMYEKRIKESIGGERDWEALRQHNVDTYE